jgi:hypothetical protein
LISGLRWEAIGDHVKRLERAGKALKVAKTPDDLFEWKRVHWTFVKDAAVALERSLKDAWRVRCEAPFGDHERLGAVLRLLPEMNALGLEMIKTAREGRELGNSFPPAPEQRAKLAEFTNRALEQCQKLKERGASEELSGLLVAAAENRATLADLTTEALEWLRFNNALTLFELHLARAPAR